MPTASTIAKVQTTNAMSRSGLARDWVVRACGVKAASLQGNGSRRCATRLPASERLAAADSFASAYDRSGNTMKMTLATMVAMLTLWATATTTRCGSRRRATLARKRPATPQHPSSMNKARSSIPASPAATSPEPGPLPRAVRKATADHPATARAMVALEKITAVRRRCGSIGRADQVRDRDVPSRGRMVTEDRGRASARR